MSDGLIIVVPEWGGMVPPALKNIFSLANRGEFAHKPALIVAISSGVGGAYPVAELRAFSCKNNQLCYIPDHVVIRDVASVLENLSDKMNINNIGMRIRYSLRVFKEYVQAFQLIRNSEVIDLKLFPYVM